MAQLQCLTRQGVVGYRTEFSLYSRSNSTGRGVLKQRQVIVSVRDLCLQRLFEGHGPEGQE